jgi:predicted CopG family antitoxin
MTKNIAIADDAYLLLARHKRPDESFSEVIRERFGKRKLTDFAGIWADVPESEWKEFEAHVENARKGLSTSLQKRLRKAQ